VNSDRLEVRAFPSHLYFSFDIETRGGTPAGTGRRKCMEDVEMQFNGVKVFSATKAREREDLGNKITEWLANHGRDIEIVDHVVTQSSDNEFHCLTITLFYNR
jgi:hypothetical protein